jgi:molecular chaperone DnaK
MELSTTMETDINLPFITADASGPKHMNIKLSRAKLESLVPELIEKWSAPARLRSRTRSFPQGHQRGDSGRGMTRMPRVQQKVKEISARSA